MYKEGIEIKYSVVIPHYNDIDGLKQLIPTIPDQPNIQIIIVDDNTYKDEKILIDFVNLFNYSNITLAFNEKTKRGAGGCRNIGLSLARGKWLIFSDADDYFLPNAFKAFEKNYFSESDIIYYYMTSVNLPRQTLGSRHLQYKRLLDNYKKTPSKDNELNLRFNYPTPCAKMIKREMVENNHIIFDDIRWSNDDMFATQCGFYAKKVFFSPETVYCIVRKNGTITTTSTEESFKVCFDTYIRKILYLRNHLPNKDFKQVIRWPGNKIILSKLKGFDMKMTKYILNEYKKHKISLWWINHHDINEFLIRIKSFLYDRKYH